MHAFPVGEVSHDAHAHIQAAFDLADAAAATASSTSSSSGGFLAPVTNSLETVLKTIQEQLDHFHVPYSYGYSILILTAIVKLVTLPLTKKQVCSLSTASVAAHRDSAESCERPLCTLGILERIAGSNSRSMCICVVHQECL